MPMTRFDAAVARLSKALDEAQKTNVDKLNDSSGRPVTVVSNISVALEDVSAFLDGVERLQTLCQVAYREGFARGGWGGYSGVWYMQDNGEMAREACKKSWGESDSRLRLKELTDISK